MSDWTDIVDDVIGHVTLLKELGGRVVELPPGFFEAWDKAPPPCSGAAVLRPGGGGDGNTGNNGNAGRGDSQNSQHSQYSHPQQGGAQHSSAATPGPSQAQHSSAATLAAIAMEVGACVACPLHAGGRTKVVPGQGNPDAPDVMFIGEAPGEEEDRQGLAFVGAAGQFLTKMIGAMGYTRDQVFIANICKCRPPNNRTPDAEEMQKCLPFLRRQIKIIRPKTIVLLGGTAVKGILNSQAGVTRMQGVWTSYEGIPVMPTYHPSYVIRFEKAGDAAGMKTVKTQVWNALKLVLERLGKPVPQQGKK